MLSTVNIECGIYGLRCKTTNKWYVGQSCEIPSRWNKYKNLNCKNQQKLLRALLKYGYDDFEKTVLEECKKETPQDELDSRETHWMAHYDSINNGYNIKTGGSRGKFSDESKRKMSLAHTGKVLSEETKQKIGIGNTGKVMSPDAILKTSAANRGLKRSDETKLKMSAAKLGKKLGPHSEEHRKKISLSNIGKHGISKLEQTLSKG